MIEEVKQLISKGFRKIFLYANESSIKAITLVIIFFIFIPPIIERLQNFFFKSIPYIEIGQQVFSFLTSIITLKDVIFVGLIIVESVFIFILHKDMLRTQKISENFRSTDLNKWNIPRESVWTVEECEDVPGKMLSISNSSFPGTLKETYTWYDYEINVLVKIDAGQDFGVTVRSENNLNGILVCLNKREISVFLLYQGTFILDDKNKNFLPTTIKEGVWTRCKLVVKGNNIDMWISNYKILSYKIPTLVYKVENKYLGTTTNVTEIENSNKKIKEEEDKDLELYKKYTSLPKGPDKDAAQNLYLAHYISPNTKVVLEYQNGSMGLFSAKGQEKQAFFRDIQIKKI